MGHLLLWEKSQRFKQTYNDVHTTLRALEQQLQRRGYRGTITPLTRGGEIIASVNPATTNRPGLVDANEALSVATRQGAYGQYTVDVVRLFAEGQGPVIKRAMHELGFKPGTRRAWIRGKEVPQPTPREKPFPFLEGERARLESLVTLDSCEPVVGRTYMLEACTNGMLYGHLWVGLGAVSFEQLGHLMEKATMNRGHIDTEQEGFTFNARNVPLKRAWYVHVTATADNTVVAERVWPRAVTEHGLDTLLSSFTKGAAYTLAVQSKP